MTDATTDDGRTFLDRLMDRRDRERVAREGTSWAIRESDTVLEDNRHGRMRWYLHPDIPGACIKSTIVYRYELGPGESTGRQLVQGNIVSYVLSGFGHTIIDGEEHRWEAGDVIALPPRMNGLTYQHVNDSDEVAMLVTAEPNLIDVFGVDLGSGFEQLADAGKDAE